MKINRVLCSLSLVVAAACGSSSSQTATQAPAAAEPTPVEPEAQADAPAEVEVPAAWSDDLSHEQKVAFMKQRVGPTMRELWKESPEPDEEITCGTCHGAGAKEGKFEMPNPKLYPLNPANGFAAHKDEADWLEFMGKKVAPTMVQTLGVQPYDPATKTGFGCFSCHGMAK